MPGVNRLFMGAARRSMHVGASGPAEGPNIFITPNTFTAGSGDGWSLFSDTVTNNTTVAPDSTTTAATIALPAVADFHQHNATNAVIPDAGQFKARIYIKPGVNVDWVGMVDGSGSGTVFRLSTVAVVSKGNAAATATITSVANGFLKLETVFSNFAGNVFVFRVSATQGNAALGTSYTPGGSDTAFAWNAYLGTFR